MAAKKNKSLVSKVVTRAGVVARELRDIPTAAGTVAKTIANVKPDRVAITPTAKSQKAINEAGSNLGKQLKEVGSAIISGKSGTTSAQSKVKREVIAGKKRQAPKPTAKPVVKTTTKAKPKLNPSEKAFIAGQKKKADILKKTGKYPNTAN